MDAAAIARDATILAKGPIDWRRQTAQGVALQVSVAKCNAGSISSTPAPAMTGTLTGAVDRCVTRARPVKSFDQWGLSPGQRRRPHRPVFAKGEIRVQTDLTTAGGAGEGLMPTLFGPAPRIRLEPVAPGGAGS